MTETEIQSYVSSQIASLVTRVQNAINSNVGHIAWWPNTVATVPTGWLVCNGATVSRTTYSLLFSRIGTKYGTGDGSTTFGLPNLIYTADKNNTGNFIRATTSDSVVGTTTNDQIRNIWARVSLAGSECSSDSSQGGYASYSTDSGAFSTTYVDGWGGGHSQTRDITRLTFNSNSNGRSGDNEMAGHSNGADIHPYTIYLVPLIYAGITV